MQKIHTLIYFFESYYFQSWQTIYQNHKGVWFAFQEQETTTTIDEIKKEIQLVLSNLGGMNQGEYISLIRKFGLLHKVKSIREYLENMLAFLT